MHRADRNLPGGARTVGGQHRRGDAREFRRGASAIELCLGADEDADFLGSQPVIEPRRDPRPDGLRLLLGALNVSTAGGGPLNTETVLSGPRCRRRKYTRIA
jgi:hypothetical protein